MVGQVFKVSKNRDKVQVQKYPKQDTEVPDYVSRDDAEGILELVAQAEMRQEEVLKVESDFSERLRQIEAEIKRLHDQFWGHGLLPEVKERTEE